jgi:hypothetical protein
MLIMPFPTTPFLQPHSQHPFAEHSEREEMYSQLQTHLRRYPSPEILHLFIFRKLAILHVPTEILDDFF